MTNADVFDGQLLEHVLRGVSASFGQGLKIYRCTLRRRDQMHGATPLYLVRRAILRISLNWITSQF